MNRIFLSLLLLLNLSSCKQKSIPLSENRVISFKVFLRPSFEESAEISLTKTDTHQTMQFLIMDREFLDMPGDTFYLKQISLSKNQYHNFDSLVIKKTNINQPRQWTGCCDGMPVTFLQIQGVDTVKLAFRSPDIKSDSSGYELTKAAIEQFRLLYSDSVITDYLQDIESNMDDTKHHTEWNEDRPIIRLRKMKYSR